VERVAFLLEETGERLCCLLNPENLVFRRRAGVQTRLSGGEAVTGINQTDDQLIYSGGGTTELTLDLVFDVSLVGSSIETDDVRQLTTPIWNLAENTGQMGEYGHSPLVLFVWGKCWNFPGIVTAVAERFEYFTSSGLPQRSWLRMRMRRVKQQDTAETPVWTKPLPSTSRLGTQSYAPEILTQQEEAHQVVEGEYLYQIADRYLGDPGRWRDLALLNNVNDPLNLKAGEILKLPSFSQPGVVL
jgi:Contractile injection system tube protein/LysM domain